MLQSRIVIGACKTASVGLGYDAKVNERRQDVR